MNKPLSSFIPFILSAYAHTGLACTPPAKPDLPDPATAVTPQMVKAKNDVKAYLAAAEKYLQCNLSTKQHNHMVDEMHEVADNFNAIAKSYKERISG